MTKKIKPVFIGIAGGTGAGKSTSCIALLNKHPDIICMIQVDDYFKSEKDVPVFNGHKNWDDPDALFLDKLYNDLNKLAEGKSVIINTKNERLNSEYKKTKKRILVEFYPKPIILVEGYLLLFNTKIRNFLSYSIWLDLDHKTRWNRRAHFKYLEYEQNVLIPMHHKFIEPTKQYADSIIYITHLSKEEVLEKIEALISIFFP